jgi:hypothetical protein
MNIDGFSKSAWRSLAVKSLRMGWIAGLRRAQEAIGKSEVKQILTCGTFEDIFPAEAELRAVLEEIKALDYTALCSRQTHHGRGLTPRFCELEPRAVAAASGAQRELWNAARPYGLFLPPRSLNCFWTWLEIHPTDVGQRREVDATPWAGMPSVMLDGHTLEGKIAKRSVTLLSGHYHQHLKLSRLVAAGGWEAIRTEAHGSGLVTARPAPQGEFCF